MNFQSLDSEGTGQVARPTMLDPKVSLQRVEFGASKSNYELAEFHLPVTGDPQSGGLRILRTENQGKLCLIEFQLLKRKLTQRIWNISKIFLGLVLQRVP